MENQNNHPTTTYFCGKCGTQISQEATACPQCGALTPKRSRSHKKFSKMIIVIPLIIIITVLITTLTLRHLNETSPSMNKSYEKNVHEDTNSNNTNQKDEVITTNVSSVCPASEYGNHDWSSATCTHPAQCYNCDAYKDDKLGNHDWEPATCIEPSKCFFCDAYKDDKLASHHNWYDYDSGRKCQDCHLSYDDYIIDKE